MSQAAPRCPACTSALPPDAAHCPQCGVAQAMPPAPPPQELSWEIGIPLVTNRFIWLDMTKALGIPMVLLALFLFVLLVKEEELDQLPQVLRMLGLVGAFLVANFLLVCLGFFWNRIDARFTLTPRAASYEMTSRRGKLANRVAAVAGLLAGRPGVAGAGLLAASQEAMEMPWADVYRVTEHPRLYVLDLRNSWRTVIRVYCTAGNYPVAVALAREYAAAGTERRRRREARERAQPRGPVTWPQYLGLSVLLLLATMFLPQGPWELPPWLAPVGFFLGLGALWLPGLRRFLGGVLLAAALLGGGLLVRAAVEVRHLTGLEALLENEFRNGRLQLALDRRAYQVLYGTQSLWLALSALALLLWAALGLWAFLARSRTARTVPADAPEAEEDTT